MTDTKTRTKRIVMAALFGVLAYLCTLIFHLKVGFLTFDIKDAVLTLAGMLFGPIAALASTAIAVLIEAISISSTGPYGTIMDAISSVTFVLPVSLIYTYRRHLSFAAIGLTLSVLLMTSAMMLANLLITPLYMGVSGAEVAALIPTLLLPFNLTKAILNAGVVLVIYKPISEIIRRAGLHGKARKEEQFNFNWVSLLIIGIGIALVVLAALYFVLEMGATLA